MKSFKYWSRQEVNMTFDLIQTYDEFEPLNTWLNTSFSITIEEENELQKLAKKLMLKVDDWNEEELKMWFISPLLRMIDYEVNNFTAFVDRIMSFKINDETVSGKVDLFVARGYEQPLQPYFFLHEYKPARKGDSDPIGQLLIAMVAAQKSNKEKHLIYGCYVVGRNWYFVVLDGNKYSISNTFNATEYNNLNRILNALLYVKDLLKTIK